MRNQVGNVDVWGRNLYVIEGKPVGHSCRVVGVKSPFRSSSGQRPFPKAIKADFRKRRWDLRSNAENRAIAVSSAIRGGPIQLAIASLKQPRSRILAICARRLRAKAVEGGQHATQSDFEDRPTAVGTSHLHDSVQVSVCGL